MTAPARFQLTYSAEPSVSQSFSLRTKRSKPITSA